MDGVFKCLSAVLLLGEIKFDDSTFNKSKGRERVEIGNKDILKKISTLLGCENPSEL